MDSAKIVDLRQARDQFETLVRGISQHREPWIVQDKGVSLAAIVSMDDYEDMLETVGELADPEYLATIREARSQYQAGEVDPLQDLRDIAEDKA